MFCKNVVVMDLFFNDIIPELDMHFTQNGWTKVCDQEMFCGLIHPMDINGAMAHYGWDLLYQESVPTIEMTVTPPYARFGSSQCEALVIYREGYEDYDSYAELSEEFRLFFNLRQDYKTPTNQVYYAINGAGTRDKVVMMDWMMVFVAKNYLKN